MNFQRFRSKAHFHGLPAHLTLLKSAVRHRQIISVLRRRNKSSTAREQNGKTKKWSPVWQFASAAVLAGAIWATFGVYQKSTQRAAALSPAYFSTFILNNKEELSADLAILTLRRTNWLANLLPKRSSEQEHLHKCIWSIEIKQPQLQIARRYTPLPLHVASADGVLSSADPNDMRLLIRREPSGEVSNYLHRLPIGAQVEVRGPYVEYDLPQDVGSILFLAGGTGIAPALQTARSLFLEGSSHNQRASRQSTGPNMRILWATRRAERPVGPNKAANQRRSPLEQQLQLVASELGDENFTVDRFIDEEGTFIRRGDLADALEKLQKAKKSPEKSTLVIVSGPEGFVNYLVGPKELRMGVESQGPVAGLLGNIAHRNIKVWKL